MAITDVHDPWTSTTPSTRHILGLGEVIRTSWTFHGIAVPTNRVFTDAALSSEMELRKVGVKNLQEDAVRRKFEELKPTMPEFCGCEMCCDDVLVYALNRLSPRYVAQPTGEVITNVSLESDQPKADMSVVILEGMRRVSAEPRADHPPN